MAFLAAAVLAPEAAVAQGDAYARIFFSTTQVYDDNLFFAAAPPDRQSDFIGRFGPALEAGYLSDPVRLVAHYAFDAERYLNHVELNKNVARQDAAIELQYLSTRRLLLALAASYVETQRPLELNLESGLAVGRAHAERLAASPMATYEWTGRTRLKLAYDFARDVLAGGVAANVDSMSIGIEQRAGARNTRRINYRFHHFGFSDRQAEVSHIVSVGWARGITRRSSLEIEVGPRLSKGAISPEFSTLLRRRLRQAELSAGYSRTQATAIGETGSIEVQRAALALTHRPARYLTLTVAPAFIRSTHHDWHASVYALDLGATAQITSTLSLMGSSRVGLQKRTLSGRLEEIPYRSLSLKLVAALPGRSPSERRPPPL